MQDEYILYLKDCKNKANPICVDFTKYNRVSTELLKACGINNKKINILDCTAGLGRDSFILACTGCFLTALENNPVVYALLKDGIERGLKNDCISSVIKNIELINQDSIDYMKNIKKDFYCIYLDPMFDKSKKNRLVKKEMQIFHNLIDNTNNEILFNLAFEKTQNRVVVKRSLHSELIINNIKPSFQIKGKTIRYDIYIK